MKKQPLTDFLSPDNDRSIVLNGARPLSGVINLSGSKHTILHILGTLWLLGRNVVIKNVPNIWDVKYFLDIYQSLGLKYTFALDELRIDIKSSKFNYTESAFNLATKFRSSLLLLASLLAKNGYVKFPVPGGDKIGERSLDNCFKVLDGFGISHVIIDGMIEAKVLEPLQGDRVINLGLRGNNRAALAIILAAASQGQTTIINPLPNPEIIDLCYFIDNFICAVDIVHSIGGIDKIIVDGRKKMGNNFDGTYTLAPDKCEMGFWMAVAAGTKSQIECVHNYPIFFEDSLGPLTHINQTLLKSMGIFIKIRNPYRFIIDGQLSIPHPTNLIVPANGELAAGLSLDVCPQFIPFLSGAYDKSIYCDTKYKSGRVLPFLDGLKSFGVKTNLFGELLEFGGTTNLCGAEVECHDIRGAAVLLITALSANGESKINNLFHLNRGYSNLLYKLQTLSVKITQS